MKRGTRAGVALCIVYAVALCALCVVADASGMLGEAVSRLEGAVAAYRDAADDSGTTEEKAVVSTEESAKEPVETIHPAETPDATAVATGTPTAPPAPTAAPSPTAVATDAPAAVVTEAPTEKPAATPSPSPAPSPPPTAVATKAIAAGAKDAPTEKPAAIPSPSPSLPAFAAKELAATPAPALTAAPTVRPTAVPTQAPTASPSPSPAQQLVMRVDASAANIRKEPHADSPRVGRAVQNETVIVLDSVLGENGTVWYQVELADGTVGYVSSKLLAE